MKNRDAAKVAYDLADDWRQSTARARRLETYSQGRRPEDKADSLPMPDQATAEYAALEKLASGGYGKIVVDAVTQHQFVESHRPTDESEASEVFKRTWRPNGMPQRQLAVHRGANATGQSFIRTLPGRLPGSDTKVPVMRGISSTRATAWYSRDDDEFPEYVMEGEVRRGEKGGDKQFLFKLADDEKIFTIITDSISEASSYRVAGVDLHEVGIPPYIRFAPRVDLEGRCWGEIEPVIPLLRRLDQDLFDRLVVQRFGAWRVRYATGLATPKTEAEKAAASLMLRVGDLLVSSNKETSFGTLEPTSLDGFLKAREADERNLSAVTQIPAYQLAGTVDNVSSEGLAMMQAGLAAHTEETRVSFGQSYDSLMRTNAYMLDRMYPEVGFLAIAQDYETTTVWRNTEIRSLEHAASALGDLSQNLGIPPSVLRRFIPGWQKIDEDLTVSTLEGEGILGDLMSIVQGAAAPREQAQGGATGGDTSGAAS